MARNSRFRSTSGPSSNRSRPEKGKTRDSGTKRGSFRKVGGSPNEENSFSKKGPVKDKPFQKGPWRDKREQPEGEKSGDYARRRVSKISAKDKPFSERDEDKKKFHKEDRSNRRAGNPTDATRRGARPFSKDDFKKRPPAPEGKSRSDDKQKPIRRGPGGKDIAGEFRKTEGNREVSSFSRKRRQAGDKGPALSSSKLEGQRNAVSDSSAESVSDKSVSDLIRLNKFISNSGVCSRREADNLITMGLITVNGKSVTELGYKVKVTDDVRYEGRRLKSEKPVYILLNKPKGYITTTDDPQERNTVMQLIHGACKERVYPVGRLDRNTSGLLLLTNDGDLTDKLTHPSYNVKKIYKAELNKPLTKADFQKILDGVRLEEGKAIVDDLAIVSDDGKTVGIEIHIGWNRVIRRVFEALDYEVVRLDRSVYATLDKKDLSRGHWRFLRQDEIIRLKHFQ